MAGLVAPPAPPSPTEAKPASSLAGPEIVLAPVLMAGKPTTLAVVASDGRLLSDATVELSDGRKVRTDETGRATLLAPANSGPLTARLVETDSASAGGRAASGAVWANAPVVSDVLDPLSAFHVDRVPLTFARKEFVPLIGFGFGGRADQNRVWLGNEPALVLASSPLAIVFAPSPRTPLGPSPLILQSGTHRVEAGTTTVVDLGFSAYADTLKAGQKSYVYVMVQGTDDSVPLTVRNFTPEAVRLSGGEEQLVTSNGGPTNSAAVEVAAHASGAIRLVAWVVPPPSATPTATRVRQFLLAARGHADSAVILGLNRLLRELDKDSLPPQKIRGELVKLIRPRLTRDGSSAPSDHSEFELYLEAALQILPGR